jgi:hypothetical protein
MKIQMKAAALFAGLALLAGTTAAGCEGAAHELPSVVHDLPEVLHPLAIDLGHGGETLSPGDLRSIAGKTGVSDLKGAASSVASSTVLSQVNADTDNLDAASANAVIAKACQLANLSPAPPPPAAPLNQDSVNTVQTALQNATNNNGYEDFAAYALCRAAEIADSIS